MKIFGRKPTISAWVGIIIVAFFILREHWEHALGLAPYILLLACPLMHLFGHRHGDGDEGPRHRPKARQR